MPDFPLKYEASASSEAGTHKEWTAQSPSLPPIISSVPPEFQGPGTGYNPESLLGIALLNCLISLIKINAEKQNLQFERIDGRITVYLEKQPNPPFIAVGEIDLKLHIKGAKDEEKLKKLCEQAMRDCPIGNAIKTGKTFDLSFSK